MNDTEAGQRIRELIDAGYLEPVKRFFPGSGWLPMHDEFVVWHPDGAVNRMSVLNVIHGRDMRFGPAVAMPSPGSTPCSGGGIGAAGSPGLPARDRLEPVAPTTDT